MHKSEFFETFLNNLQTVSIEYRKRLKKVGILRVKSQKSNNSVSDEFKQFSAILRILVTISVQSLSLSLRNVCSKPDTQMTEVISLRSNRANAKDLPLRKSNSFPHKSFKVSGIISKNALNSRNDVLIRRRRP